MNDRTGARRRARAEGKVRYLGSPCRNCGCEWRYTRNGSCVKCSSNKYPGTVSREWKREYNRKWMREKRKSDQTRDRLKEMTPEKPKNVVKKNGWPFGWCFQDDPRACKPEPIFNNVWAA